jgi:PAS domain S-box-containing protein
LLRKRDSPSLTRRRRVAANALASTAAVVGLLSLAEHVFGWDFGIDQLLATVPSAARTVGLRPGLMSPFTAFDSLVLGLALLLLDRKTRRDDWPAQFLILGAMIGTVFGLLGLFLESTQSPVSMAWPTAATFFVLACGLLCSRATWALGGLLTSRSKGARLLRGAVPSALLVLGLIGWFISKPLLTESHFTWVEVSALGVFSSLALVGFIAWMAFVVERGDAERERAEAALSISKEQLDRLMDRTEQPESERRLLRKVNAAFALALLVTGLLGVLSWHNAQRAAEDADWVAHTHEMSTTLELTLRNLLDVETGARGFALTGDKRFLEPYETGKDAVGQDLRALRILIVDQDQKPRLDVLAEQASGRIEAANELVALRQRTGMVPAELQLKRGKEIMDATRATVEQMEAEEGRLLRDRSLRARNARHFAVSTIALGSVLGVAFLSVAGFTVRREIGISAKARAQVDALNSQLEQRVAERTAALGESEGRLSNIVQSAMDAIVTTDDQQRILVFNAAAEKMFRCPAARALGQPVTRFIPQRFHAAHDGHIKKFGENGATARAMGKLGVLWGVRADGEEFRIEASISHFGTAGKNLFTVILRDITERLRAEAIREHLASVVDSSDDAIISKDLNGTINAWNRGAEKIFGYSAAEAIGKPMVMIFPRGRVNEEADILDRIRHGESVEHFETVRVRKDGTKIDVSATISPIRDASGAIVGASKIARDISEHKRTQEALREHAQIMDSAQVFVRDMQSRVVFWPKGAEKLYGFTREEAVGILSHDLFHTKFPEPLEVVEKKLFETGIWEGELIHTRRDGSIIVVSSAWVLHRDKQGQPIRILETNIDITARKQAEERQAGQAEELSRQAGELARSRQALETQTLMLRSVLDSIGEGLVAADETGKFLLWNPAASRIVGMGAENVPPGEWNQHYGVFLPDTVTPFPPEQNPLLRAIRGEVCVAEMYLHNQELESGVWIETSASPLKDKDGVGRGGVIAIRDITQRKIDEREIRKLNDDLEEKVAQRTTQLETANHELEAFTYSVSHDLRAPLRHIGGFSRILIEDFGSTMDPEARRHLERIEEGTHRMGLLVDELLNLARVGRHTLSLRVTSLNPLIEEVVSLLQPETEGRAVVWKISSLPPVNCDPILIKQVFQNLIANALKFTRPRERAMIEISHREKDGQIVIEVRDNGVGFSMKYTDKLFGVFQRLHRAEDFEGTGIGLATAHRILHKHGERIWAEAELDKGAAFFFTLAAANATRTEAGKGENKTAIVGAQS